MTSSPSVSWQRNWLFILFLFVATFAAYYPAWHAGFIWNDEKGVTDNPDIFSFHGLGRIWFDPSNQYYPLTYSTFWLQYHIWGFNPVPYHLANIALHALNAVLLWFVLRRLSIPGAWLAAGIFALHPVNVESVAWVTERKNTLSGFFYLCTLLAAFKFWLPEETAVSGSQPPVRLKDWKSYWLAFVLFVCGLFSKTTIIPLPAVILLLIWWKRRKIIGRDVSLLLPFMVVGIAIGYVTHWAEKRLSEGSAPLGLSFVDRFLVSSRDVWFYLGKVVWPHPLVFVYPRWKINASSPLEWLPLLALIAIFFILWLKRNSWGRVLFVTLAYYVGLLFLMLGFFNIFFFHYSFVADHFQYLACMAPIALAAAAITTVFNRWAAPAVPVGATGNPSGSVNSLPVVPLIFAICLFELLGVLTWFQSRIYVSDETIWNAVLIHNPDCYLAHNNLGDILSNNGQEDAAIEQYEMAMALQANSLIFHNLGDVYLHKGMLNDALANYRKEMELKTDSVGYADLGNYYLHTGQSAMAIQYLQKSLQLKPDVAMVCYNLGDAYMQNRQVDMAIQSWQKSLAIMPNYAMAHNNLGNAMMMTGHVPEAIQHWKAALATQPNLVGAQVNLAWVWSTSPLPAFRDGKNALALAEEAACLTDGKDPMALRSLAAAFAENGQFANAVAIVKKALQLANLSGNRGLASSLLPQINVYQSGQPFRDTSIAVH